MEWEAKISLPTTKSGSDKVKAAPPRTRIFGFQDQKISVFNSVQQFNRYFCQHTSARARTWLADNERKKGKKGKEKKRFVPEYIRQLIPKGNRYRLLFTGERHLLCHIPHSPKPDPHLFGDTGKWMKSGLGDSLWLCRWGRNNVDPSFFKSSTAIVLRPFPFALELLVVLSILPSMSCCKGSQCHLQKKTDTQDAYVTTTNTTKSKSRGKCSDNLDP